MKRRQMLAAAAGFIAFGLALVQPLWIRATGEEITLDIRPVDPLSLFRGNYVDLNYDVEAPEVYWDRRGETAFVTVDDGRPAKILNVSTEKPTLAPGEFCVRGKFDFGRVQFPNLEQFFVTPERGSELETSLNTMVAVVKVTSSCRSVLVDIQPE